MTVRQVKAALEEWEVFEAIDTDGELIGTVIAKGTEVHICVKPSCRKLKITRRNVKQLIWPIYDRMGFLTTRVNVGDDDRRRFVEKFGFQETWADDRFAYYMMTEKPYEKR